MATALDAARDLDRRLKEMATRARRAEAELAAALFEMQRSGLFKALGYARVQDYALVELDMARGKAKELIELAARLVQLPALAKAFGKGELSWTKARQVARVATREDEDIWIQRAKILTNRGLEDAVAEAKGEAPKVRITMELTREEAAELEEAVRRLREERGEAVTLGAAVVELAKRALAAPGEGPGYQIVIQECPTCGTASRDATTVEAAKEDAVVVDGRTGEQSSVIPPSVRRMVLARDGHKCRICGARGWLHIHHREPASHGGSGRDPDNLVTLCGTCHKRLVHERHVTLEGIGATLTVRLRDGSERAAVA